MATILLFCTCFEVVKMYLEFLLFFFPMETLFFAIQMKSNNWIAFVENVGISIHLRHLFLLYNVVVLSAYCNAPWVLKGNFLHTFLDTYKHILAMVCIGCVTHTHPMHTNLIVSQVIRGFILSFNYTFRYLSWSPLLIISTSVACGAINPRVKKLSN